MSRLIIPTILSAHSVNDEQSQIYHQIILYFNILLVMLKIDITIKQEIEEAIGQTIPDPQSSQFEAFFEKLARDHPELAQKLEQALEVTEPYPEEEAQKQAKRRETIANGIQRLFYTEMWGRQALNRRALSLLIFFFIFGVMATSWSLTFFRRPAKAVEATTPQQVTPMPTAQNEPAPQNASPIKDANNLLIVPEVEVKTTPKQDNEPKQEVLEVPTFGEVSSDAPPQTLLGNVSSSPNVSTNKQTITEVVIPQTPILTVEDEPVSVTSEASAIAFEPVQLAIQPVTTISADESVQEQQPVLAFTEQVDSSESSSALEQTPSDSLRSDDAISGLENPVTASDKQNSEEKSPVLAFEEDSESDVAQELGESETNTPQASTPDSSLSQEPPTSNSPQPTLESENEPLLETDVFDPTTPTEFLKPGMLIAATLQKDIILAEGETRQVIADSDATWCGEGSLPFVALDWYGNTFSQWAVRCETRASCLRR
jgi:hypothetical protein